MNNLFRQPVLVAGLIALTTTVIVASAKPFFPGVAQRVTEWQVGLIESPTPHPAITMITLKPQGTGSCGEAIWNRALLAQTITALSQAAAKVIVPILPLEGPSSSACGGAASDAELIEATTQSGRVIYPNSVFEPIKNQALAVGNVSSKSALETEVLPLGIAIAKEYGTEIILDFSPPTFFSSWVKGPFSEYTFDALWNLIQDKQWRELTSLVKDKIIILSPEMSEARLAQIHMLNAILTESWLQQIGTGAEAFIVLFFSFSTTWTLLLFPNRKGVLTAFGFIGVFIALAISLQTQFGLILPVIGMTLVFAGSTVSAGLFYAYIQRIQASTHIFTLRRNLSQLHKKLMRKEHHALSLVESLTEARLAEQESVTRLTQLELAQTEVETTRQQLHAIEAELKILREQTTETVEEPSRLTPDLDSLSVECQTFGILTKDPHVLKVFSDIKKAAKSSSPILLLGETGTGKEVFAQAVHQLSDRARRPFIPVNMAAIRPELFESELFGHVKGAFTGAIGGKGYVEAAEGGTLFLDEMGELSLDLQAKLLRLLENKTFNRVGEARTRQANVRILIATNRDLKQEVEQGRFREDLYYRLRSIVLVLPALRERIPEDRRLLAEHFLQHFANQDHRDKLRLNQGALHTIMSYPWPGNIRELKQTIAQAVSLAETDILTKKNLRLSENRTVPGRVPIHSTQQSMPPKKSTSQNDDTILTALRQHRFDMQATAQALHCDRSTVTQRLKGLGYEALVKNQGDFALAARDLANDESLEELVEQKLREYEGNLLPRRKRYQSVEEAIADCRRRFKNLPDRYLPAVEILIRDRFSSSV